MFNLIKTAFLELVPFNVLSYVVENVQVQLTILGARLWIQSKNIKGYSSIWISRDSKKQVNRPQFTFLIHADRLLCADGLIEQYTHVLQATNT